MNDSVIQINALGRSVHLGQLYDARKSQLIPSFSLYASDAVEPMVTNTEETKFKLEQVKSFSDRAKTLDISAQLSVTIMSGAITISGGGSYLSKQQDTSESYTVAAIAKFRKGTRSLDLTKLQKRELALSDERLAKTHATHFVTSITYGANIVGTLTQKSSDKSDSTEIKGNFSLEAFKNLGKMFSAEGKAELSMEDKELIKSYNLDVELVTDIKLGNEKMPIEPVSMLELVAKSPSLVGEGVPCEIQLMPLSMLASNIPSFRELAAAHLTEISNTYDNILRLENSCLWLLDSVEEFSDIFSSFAHDIRKRTVEVTKLVQQARAELRDYLERYRSSDEANGNKPSEDPKANFTSNIDGKFTTAITNYKNDLDQWRRLQDRMAAAKRHGFPIIGVGAIGTRMNQVDQGMLAAILVPQEANWAALMNLYSDLGVDIRQWRASVDKAPEGKDGSKALATQYVTIYTDPLHENILESFDDEAGTLKSALVGAEKTKKAVFLTYGRGNTHLGGLAWNVLNNEGWGIITDKLQNWRYIGDVHLGKPHGSGVMTYVDNTKYAGDFVLGRRDGAGKLLDVKGMEIAGKGGVWIQNKLERNGVIVKVTLFDDSDTPVQYGKVALNRFASVSSNVDRIGTIMGWDEKMHLRLVLGDRAAQVDVVGSMIDSSEQPSVGSSSWPLEGAGPFNITARPL
ncbi:hypothetical protein DL93DRAFT_2164098 [Clavulina sp. PMI_390]|nr:hypothetical protein DL93DRAFT_2164098 [Clavulina sp. PMI_390]